MFCSMYPCFHSAFLFLENNHPMFSQSVTHEETDTRTRLFSKVYIRASFASDTRMALSFGIYSLSVTYVL